MIGLLLRFGLPGWTAKLLTYVGLPLMLGAAVWGFGALRYSAGYHQAETDQRVRLAEQQRAQAERERRADAALAEQKNRDEQAARGRQQEIDDATRNLPDQAPTARQRARACAELVRAGKAPPECQPSR